MRLVFVGTPEAAVPSLVALAESAHDVIAVVTRPDAAAGRGRRLVASPVADQAEAMRIDVLKPPRLADPGFLDVLGSLEPDCCPIVAFGGLVPDQALHIPRRGWINLHFSLLPAWRGAAPVHHAVLRGDEVTGATTFLLDQGLDTGPTFGTVTEGIGPSDTSGDLLVRLAASGADLLLRTIDGIAAGTVGAVPQPDAGASYAPKLTSEDGRVNWQVPALHITRQVRACTPSPGAWTTFRGVRLRLHPLALEPELTSVRPGELVASKTAVHVGTGSCAVRLERVQPQGKRLMSAVDWARGVRISTDELLE